MCVCVWKEGIVHMDWGWDKELVATYGQRVGMCVVGREGEKEGWRKEGWRGYALAA